MPKKSSKRKAKKIKERQKKMPEKNIKVRFKKRRRKKAKKGAFQNPLGSIQPRWPGGGHNVILDWNLGDARRKKKLDRPSTD